MLLQDAMEIVTMLDKHTVTEDLEGGFVIEWVEGARFKAAITPNGSTLAKIAEKQGVTDTYTVVTLRSNPLSFHDVFRRENGEVFRVTSNGEDNKTPGTATLDMSVCSAERWTL